MKKTSLILGILILFIAFSTSAQMTKEEKKQAKKERKEAKEREQEEALVKYAELAYTKQWAIQANMVYDEKNNTFILDPALNFVSLNNEDLTVQLAFTSVQGWTGIRGYTQEGTASDYEVEKSKSVKISMTGQGATMGTVKLNITIDSSGTARAYISGIGTDRLSLQGTFIALRDAGIFKDKTNY